jgi:hypothetical protein
MLLPFEGEAAERMIDVLSAANKVAHFGHTLLSSPASPADYPQK